MSSFPWLHGRPIKSRFPTVLRDIVACLSTSTMSSPYSVRTIERFILTTSNDKRLWLLNVQNPKAPAGGGPGRTGAPRRLEDGLEGFGGEFASLLSVPPASISFSADAATGMSGMGSRTMAMAKVFPGRRVQL